MDKEIDILEKLEKIEKIQTRHFFMGLLLGTLINIALIYFIHTKR